MTTQKSRKNPRALVTLVARYRSPTAFEYVEEHCFDLSSGGMFIESNAPAPAGTLIKLECDVNDGVGTLKGVARVVWLREQESDGQPKGMGVKFLKLEPGGRELILQLLGERASLPPTDSIPPSRRSWSPSVAPSPRSSGAPTASSSQAPPLQRPSLAAAKAAELVAKHQEVQASELSVAAGPGVSEATEAAAASAFEATAAPSAEAPSAEAESLSAGSELVSGAVSVEAASSAVMAVDAQVHEPAGAGHATEHATTAADHVPEHGGGATPHQDHRPHAHELRERLARRAAAQRAAAANAALAAQAAQIESPRAEAASEPSPMHAAATAAAESGRGAAGEAAGWQEPARAPEPAPAAAPPSTRPAPRVASTAEGAAATRPVTDERREFTLKGDVPVEEMPKRRGAVYLGLIGAGVALILLLQLRKGDQPEPTAAPDEPAPAAASTEPAPAPVAATPEPPPPPPVVEPAQTYVVELTTTPEGATVELGGQSTTTPAQLALGTLAAPVTVSVRKQGFEPASLEIDQTGFVLEGGQLRRHIALSLSALPPPPPPPPVVAVKEPEPAPEPRAAKKPAAERPRRERPAPASASAKPTPEPAPKPTPKPAPEPPAAAEPAPAAAQSPLQLAMACLATGDNPCVLRALEGKASGARELELLIETHRAMGNAGKAEQLMQGYIEKFPGERRATTYRRQLDRKAAESGAGETAAPAPAP